MKIGRYEERKEGLEGKEVLKAVHDPLEESFIVSMLGVGGSACDDIEFLSVYFRSS